MAQVVHAEGHLETLRRLPLQPCEPSVVDEHVQRLVHGEEEVRTRPHRFEGAKVEGQERGRFFARGCCDARRCGGTTFRGAAGQEDLRASCHELARSDLANSGVRAGDDADFFTKIGHRLLLHDGPRRGA